MERDTRSRFHPDALFTVAKLDDFVPLDHPLRQIRTLVDAALRRMSSLFNAMYADSGRASIAPEKLLRAQLLQLFYSARSERLLMEQLRCNLLFRWFVGLAIDDPVWDHSVFSKNRRRLNKEAAAAEFLAEVVRLADQQELLSDEYFSLYGTLLQAWASQQSFRPEDCLPDAGGSGPRNAPPRRTFTQSASSRHARCGRRSGSVFRAACV